MAQKILFIESIQGFINQAIVNKLEKQQFRVARVKDDLEEIASYRDEVEIMIYYLSVYNNRAALRFLLEMCREDRKVLTVVGDTQDIAEAMKAEESDRIHATYPRPVNINQLVDDICALASSHKEYNRRKTILVIDDDSDFLKVMHSWLKDTYQVDTVRSGREAAKYLSSMRPDLILLDYIMPEQDGYEVMAQIRQNPLTSKIPIIFLTGQNDRTSVMRIINQKPDGYLLKTMKMEELLDALDRYFVESILNSPRQAT